ncbi:MAG TPA: restriction endonuclease subunit S [Sphingomonadaceae bacterium]|nr:restriction endonuclease subunit S [Sphingomonadaceae bacterium]
MAGDWLATTWGDIAELKYGKAMTAYTDQPNVARVYGTNGPIGWHDTPLQPGPGVIVGRKGAYRGVHFADHPFWVIDTAYYLKPLVPMDLRWAYYWLLDYDVNNIDDGSPIPSTTRDAFGFTPVKFPPLSEQTRIAHFLASLDAKVDLNRQMAATLEDLARALFKSWFVDFGPVHAKAEGRDTGLPAEIAALFSDSFEDDGLPKGWMQSTVGELFSIVAGNTPSTKRAEYWDGPHAWATPKDMSGLPGPLLTKTDRSLTEQGFDVCSSGEIPEMSLLMSSRAPVGYLAFNALPVSINQGIAAFVSRTLSPFYAWAWCHENMKLIKSNANGSTFQEISKGVLRTIAMTKPSQAVHDAFVVIMETTFSRIVQLAEETASLTGLRDELLPKLLSGELRVADAETVIAAA